MPDPVRQYVHTRMYLLTSGFNLKRDASPVATNNGNYNHGFFFGFQSQARCQPRGDLSGIGERIGGKNVSISSEMPAPWRRPVTLSGYASLRMVSISSEMPAPWRR